MAAPTLGAGDNAEYLCYDVVDPEVARVNDHSIIGRSQW